MSRPRRRTRGARLDAGLPRIVAAVGAALLCAALAPPAPAAAVQDRDGGAERGRGAAPPAQAAPTGTRLDDLTARVASQLRCPVCRNQSVLESSSTLAGEMQQVIRRRLAAGESPDAVKAYFVDRYGEWILLQPEPRGLNLLVYLLPAAALLGGLALAWSRIRAWASGGEEEGPTGAGASAAGTASGGGRGGPATAAYGGALSPDEERRVDRLVRSTGGGGDG